MYFYHGTTIENAEKINATKTLNPSIFDIKDYLEYVTMQKAGIVPLVYKGKSGNDARVKWLGEGIYLFDFLNEKEALSWNSRYTSTPLEECTAIRVEVEVDNIPKEHIFDLFSYSDIKELKNTLENKLRKYLASLTLNRQELLHYVFIQRTIIRDLDKLFESQPFLGGVAVDLYNLLEDGKIKLIRGIYKKTNKMNYYDVYYCLKDDKFLVGYNKEEQIEGGNNDVK